MIGQLLKTRVGVILSNWLFQGMRYMNAYELLVKLGFTGIFAFAYLALPCVILDWQNALFAILVAHTANWVLNGHLFVLMRYVYPVPKSERDFEDYLGHLRLRAKKAPYVEAAAIYGSYCRGQLHQYSDLDVRVIVSKGIVCGFLGALFCVRERFLALLATFPLDIYCSIETAGLNRLRLDESPVILFDRTGILGQGPTSSRVL